MILWANPYIWDFLCMCLSCGSLGPSHLCESLRFLGFCSRDFYCWCFSLQKNILTSSWVCEQTRSPPLPNLVVKGKNMPHTQRQPTNPKPLDIKGATPSSPLSRTGDPWGKQVTPNGTSCFWPALSAKSIWSNLARSLLNSQSRL